MISLNTLYVELYSFFNFRLLYPVLIVKDNFSESIPLPAALVINVFSKCTILLKVLH